jgi:hypothetical protein
VLGDSYPDRHQKANESRDRKSPFGRRLIEHHRTIEFRK